MKFIIILLIITLGFVSCVQPKDQNSIVIYFGFEEYCYDGTLYIIGKKGYGRFMSPKFVNDTTVKCSNKRK